MARLAALVFACAFFAFTFATPIYNPCNGRAPKDPPEDAFSPYRQATTEENNLMKDVVADQLKDLGDGGCTEFGKMQEMKVYERIKDDQVVLYSYFCMGATKASREYEHALVNKTGAENALIQRNFSLDPFGLEFNPYPTDSQGTPNEDDVFDALEAIAPMYQILNGSTSEDPMLKLPADCPAPTGLRTNDFTYQKKSMNGMDYYKYRISCSNATSSLEIQVAVDKKYCTWKAGQWAVIFTDDWETNGDDWVWDPVPNFMAIYDNEDTGQSVAFAQSVVLEKVALMLPLALAAALFSN